MSSFFYPVLSILSALALLLVARSSYRFGHASTEDQLTDADNPAFGVALFGYFAGFTCVLVVLMPNVNEISDPADALNAYGEFFVYGFAALWLLRFSGYLNRKLILTRFDVAKELIADQNTGTGFVLAGSYLASGLVLAGAFAGSLKEEALPFDANPWILRAIELSVALAIYIVTQLGLCLYGQIYQRIQPKGRDLHDEIARDYEKDGVFYGGNAAAGLAFGGNLLAFGIALFGGARPDVENFLSYFGHFGLSIACAFFCLPLGRALIDRAMLKHSTLSHEIYHDKNPNAALMETALLCLIASGIAVVL